MATLTSQTLINSMVESLKSGKIEDLGNDGGNEYTIPAHLKDLQEADLPESQRGIVLSEIALFRERAMKKEKDKPERERGGGHGNNRSAGVGGFTSNQGGPGGGFGNGPTGPAKERVWGKPQNSPGGTPTGPQQGGWGNGPQGYNKPVGFVRSSEEAKNAEGGRGAGDVEKTDEEIESERVEARRRKEDVSFRDVSSELSCLDILLTDHTARATL